MSRHHPLLAALYDPIIWPAERRTLGPLRKSLLADLHGDVLEIGAGTGLNFRYYPADARVIALEPDPAMLERARKRAAAAAARVTLELAGDERLKVLPAHSFDAVVFSLVLCSIEEPERTLRAASRVLRADGRAAVLEHVRSHGTLGAWQDRLQPLWGPVSGGCHLNRDTKTLLAQAGFDVSGLREQRFRGGIVNELLFGYARPAPVP